MGWKLILFIKDTRTAAPINAMTLSARGPAPGQLGKQPPGWPSAAGVPAIKGISEGASTFSN